METMKSCFTRVLAQMIFSFPGKQFATQQQKTNPSSMWFWLSQRKTKRVTIYGTNGHFAYCWLEWMHFIGQMIVVGWVFIFLLLVADLANTKWCKKRKNDWNPGTKVLIREYSGRAIQWIPTWQGLENFKKALHPCALNESSPSISRVKFFKSATILEYNVQ